MADALHAGRSTAAPDPLAAPPTVRASAELVDQLTGPGTPLTDAGRRQAAALLGVTLQKIAAVEAVESRGRGFRPLADNPRPSSPQGLARPLILFEPHIFHRLTGGKYSEAWPAISYPTFGSQPYPGSQSTRWDQLRQAMRLDEANALKSASWGLFQIMGFNFKPAGFAGVEAFVRTMATTEDAQLLAFAALIKAMPGAQKALQLSDWAGYARIYNGPSYAQHGYDQKLKAAYKAAIAAQSAADKAKAGVAA